MYKTAHEVRKDLLMVDWSLVWPRLLLYAERKIARMYWRGIFGGPLPGGIESHDVAMKAIEQALSGDRQWPEGVRIETFLFQSVNSIVSHIATGAENSSTTLLEEGHLNKNDAITDSDMIALSRRDKQVSDFFNSLKDDPLAHDVAAYILYYGIDKPQELAGTLKRTVPEINTAKRRLKRRIISWIEEQRASRKYHDDSAEAK
jgi:hypothetical protein